MISDNRVIFQKSFILKGWLKVPHYLAQSQFDVRTYLPKILFVYLNEGNFKEIKHVRFIKLLRFMPNF